MKYILKETEIEVLNLTQLRASKVIYRIVDVMGKDRDSSNNEYVWDENSTEPDNNNDNIMKVLL
jgi:hypothetical protein